MRRHPHPHSDSSSPSDTQNPGDSGDTTDTPTTGDGLLDVSGWDTYQTPTLEVTPVPLVPGGEAHITYRGDLAEGADLVLHYGFNGWNEVSGIDGLQALPDTGDEDWFVQADLTPTDDGAWTVTVPLPTDGRALHMVVYDPSSGVWDNNDTEDYAESLVFPYAGPYLGFNNTTDPTTAVVVNFATAVPCLGTVEYGETLDFGQVAVGEDFGTKHHIALEGLTPERTIYYRVYDSRGRVSDTYQFTPLAEDTDQASLLVMGDMQDGGATQRWDQVAVEIAASHSDADAVFLVGDMAYNDKHGIVPTAAGKKASNSILSFLELSRKLKTDGPDADLVQVAGQAVKAIEDDTEGMALDALPELIDQLEVRMKEAAKKLDFEEAANLRDRIKQLRQKLVGKG